MEERAMNERERINEQDRREAAARAAAELLGDPEDYVAMSTIRGRQETAKGLAGALGASRPSGEEDHHWQTFSEHVLDVAGWIVGGEDGEPRAESRLLPDPDPADGPSSEEARAYRHVERALRETLGDSIGAGSDLTRFEMLDGDPDSPYAMVEGQLDVWHLAVVAVNAMREFGKKA